MTFRQLVTVTSLSVVSCIGLGACSGGNYSRVNEKQSTPSDIKISYVNLVKKSIELRFEYRTYMKKSLEKIDCNINLNSGESNILISKVIDIELDPFSTELLVFENIEFNNSDSLRNLDSVNYYLNCDLKYNKGSEGVFERSVLHLIPGNNHSYR